MKNVISYVKRNKKEICCFSLSVLCVLLTLSSTVYASNTDPVDGINKLASWFLKLVQAIGAIFVIKNGYEMFTAWQQADNSGMSSALKGLVGGIGMVGLRFLLVLLGVQV